MPGSCFVIVPVTRSDACPSFCLTRTSAEIINKGLVNQISGWMDRWTEVQRNRPTLNLWTATTKLRVWEFETCGWNRLANWMQSSWIICSLTRGLWRAGVWGQVPRHKRLTDNIMLQVSTCAIIRCLTSYSIHLSDMLLLLLCNRFRILSCK